MAHDAPRPDRWLDILGVARLAPSPHNVQPWRVKIHSPQEAELFIDGMRTLPKEDLTGSFLLSAMGMFLEAIDLLAAQYNMHLEFALRESPDWFASLARGEHVNKLIPFAALKLKEARPLEEAYPPALFEKRRTCRISLHPTPVADDAVAALTKVAQAWDQSYQHLSSNSQIERILYRNIDAVFHDLNVVSYHDEITSWFRFTDREAQQYRDGLDWRCMNVSRGEFWLSARASRLLLFPPTRRWLRARYRKQLGIVPAMGMLSGDFFVAEQALKSGRFLMRFWLETAKLGLYLHPYGNLVTNPDAAAWLEGETGIKKVWLVFKLGYADEPPQSYRRLIDDILIS